MSLQDMIILQNKCEELEEKLAVAIDALEKCTKIRRKDGNDNEYGGAEAYIAKEALEKIKR